jgi:CheY-like chemotaxis protein
MSEKLDRPAVLVIDDEPLVRRLVEETLTREGFDVHGVPDGPAALALYPSLQGSIALVLLDIEMPLMDGPTTLAALRQIDPKVRCCFISGYSGYSAEQLAAMAAIGLIEKPFQLQTLPDTVKAMLGV